MSLAHSLKWSFLAELASKAVTPVVFVVLARLLTPEDFGVMSAAVMVIAFSQIFWEAGMGKALIQRQTDVIEAANVAFWVNIALGIAIAVLLFWGAEPIAMTFFQDQRVAAVLQVMTLQVILGSLSSVQTALIQKEMGFKKLFWVRLITVAFPGMASIPLAWSGLGYWALVAGALMGQLVQVAMLWRMSGWRPSWRFDPVVAKEMGRFGVWVGASGVLAWFYGWADSLIVGMYLGTHDLGLYRIGYQVVLMIYSVMFAPILPVMYSAYTKNLTKMTARTERAPALLRANNTVLTISLGVSALLSLNSDYIVSILGPQWAGANLVVILLSFTHAIAYCFFLNNEFYKAIGRADIETKITALALPFYILSSVVSIQFGLTPMLFARLATVISIGMSINFFYERMVLKTSVRSRMTYLGSILVPLLPIYAISMQETSAETTNHFFWAGIFFASFLVIIYRKRRLHYIFCLPQLAKGQI